jgi:hypothetical protein
MTNFTFHKARNFPMNRDGETIEVMASEGDLVGLTENNDGETELVAADADSGTAQPAMGVLMEDVQDPTSVNVSGFETAYIEQQQLRRKMREETDYTLVGDEGTYVFTGVYLKNNDEDTDFTPQDPVYLDVGGGFTQTEPSSSGEVVQRVGVAVDAYTVLVDVDFDYEVLA